VEVGLIGWPALLVATAAARPAPPPWHAAH
jgi:hypothetical protein